MFSQRLPPRTDVNPLGRALEELRRRGTPFVDLTESNPTQVGLPYPEALLEALADRRALTYEPDPKGMRPAREAIAADAARRGVAVDPEDIVLAASTSEAYSWLFKLFCSPGDRVLVPRPSYPLFEHLTRLEGVRTASYDLAYHGRWEIDLDSLAAAPDGARLLLLVSPNNPTGSYVSASELARVLELCAARHWVLVADEVFADYPLEAREPVTDVAQRAGVLAFTLGGASKTLGLPQLKLGWIVAGGPARERAEALAALELIADTYLSVGTPVQVAAPTLLRLGAQVRHAIHERLRANLHQAQAIAARHRACSLLRVEGGWSAVVRVPAVGSEERLVLELLERERVLIHPGYFFDFPFEAFLVVSLLPPQAIFGEAFSRALGHAAREAPPEPPRA